MKKNTFIHFISFVLFTGGLILILSTFLPILTYEVEAIFKFKKNNLISPLADEDFFPKIPSDVQQIYPFNLTSPSDWFVGDPGLQQVVSKVRYYNLSIPKLKIQNAIVEIDGEDLAKSLVHYKGTVAPGQLGNAVIFGHSSLPHFFSAKNYLSIFTRLPSLVEGDEIIVEYDGITYKYKVVEMFEVKPTAIEVLAQKFDDSYITLVTCVPPGTTIKRLIVRAKLVPFN